MSVGFRGCQFPWLWFPQLSGGTNVGYFEGISESERQGVEDLVTVAISSRSSLWPRAFTATANATCG